MCNGWKAPSAPCGLGWVPQILPQQQDTPQDTSSPEDQLPPAHPCFPQWPRARSPAGRWRRTWLRLFHTLSPSLWWWLVSQQSHLHRYAFSEGFFFSWYKSSGKTPSQIKQVQQQGGGRGGLCGYSTGRALMLLQTGAGTCAAEVQQDLAPGGEDPRLGGQGAVPTHTPPSQG